MTFGACLPPSFLGRDDLWNIKYLAKFKWHHLAESIAYQNRVAEEKMRNEVPLFLDCLGRGRLLTVVAFLFLLSLQIAQAKRENTEYLDAVDKSAQLNKMRERKRAEGASPLSTSPAHPCCVLTRGPCLV